MSVLKLGRRLAVAVVFAAASLASADAQQRTLTVYSSLDEDQAKALIRGFEVKHPQVKVNAILGSTAPIIARVIAEAAGALLDAVTEAPAE